MYDDKLLKKIRKKQKELVLLAQRHDSVVRGRVYKKSCELDDLIVQYMKTNRQLEIVFER